jgi:DNA-binding response OmpR family regulator
MDTRGTALIVDDDLELAKLLTRIARNVDLSTIHLSDGHQVVDVAVDQQPDLILLDVGLPHADGRDLLRDLKAHPRTFRIPVFVHTGRTSQVDRLAALGLGADDYFEKPFDPALLIRRIVRRISKTARDKSTRDEVDRRSSQNLRAARQERRSRRTLGAIPVGSSRPILVVEDDNDVRECICDILNDEGMEAWAARTGREALDLMRRYSLHPSLIILDLAMPDMDGSEFQRQLRGDWLVPPPRVAMMSDLGPDSGTGVGLWLQKPIDADDLLSIVQAGMRSSP